MLPGLWAAPPYLDRWRTSAVSTPAQTTKSRLAELVALGITIPDAAERIGITKGRAYSIWAEIKRELGPQAA